VLPLLVEVEAELISSVPVRVVRENCRRMNNDKVRKELARKRIVSSPENIGVFSA
jgi:hypothetical protein